MDWIVSGELSSDELSRLAVASELGSAIAVGVNEDTFEASARLTGATTVGSPPIPNALDVGTRDSGAAIATSVLDEPSSFGSSRSGATSAIGCGESRGESIGESRSLERLRAAFGRGGKASWLQVRDLWPRPPHTEQRWSLFLREDAGESLGESISATPRSGSPRMDSEVGVPGAESSSPASMLHRNERASAVAVLGESRGPENETPSDNGLDTVVDSDKPLGRLEGFGVGGPEKLWALVELPDSSDFWPRPLASWLFRRLGTRGSESSLRFTRGLEGVDRDAPMGSTSKRCGEWLEW